MVRDGDIVEKRYGEFKEIIDHYEKINDISSKNVVDDNLKKVLLLSAASYFEDIIKKIMLEFFDLNTNSEMIINFIKNKAIERQYHTYFDWKAKNANKFFSLFGDSFKKDVISEVRTNESLEKSIRDFLELGNLRNELIHENFAVFPIEKTSSEIYDLYCSASKFIDYLALKMKNQ